MIAHDAKVIDLVRDDSSLNISKVTHSSDDDSLHSFDLDHIGTLLPDTQLEATQHLYHAGRIVSEALSSKSKCTLPWPPLAADITSVNCERFVPPSLFNLMSVVVGASAEPVSLDEYATINDESARDKILSICQDIAYLKSGGKQQTPKSLALGLTIRHLTWSSDLCALLNRFGHCSSYSTVSRYETAIALKQLREDDIPKGFEKEAFTMFI